MIGRAHTQIVDQAEVGTWLSAIIALAMHYSGSIAMAPELLGATLAATLLPIAMGAIRLLNRVMAEIPDDDPPSGESSDDAGEGGFASVALLPVIALLGILLMIAAGGCGSSYHLERGGWRLEEAPCGTRLTVFGDGDPEVSVICIETAAPLKLGAEVLEALCEED